MAKSDSKVTFAKSLFRVRFFRLQTLNCNFDFVLQLFVARLVRSICDVCFRIPGESTTLVESNKSLIWVRFGNVPASLFAVSFEPD